MNHSPKFKTHESLPDDAKQVKTYNSHEFNDLYYSPSNRSFYQKTKTNRYKEINNRNNDEKQYVYARNNKARSIRISYRKFAKENGIDDLYVKRSSVVKDTDKIVDSKNESDSSATGSMQDKNEQNESDIDLEGIVDYVM